MKEFGDVDQHFDRHMEQAAEKYVLGLELAGLQPNPTLTRAVAERALQEARDSYVQETIEVRDHNIQVVIKNHRKRINQIRREGASLRIKTCPPIILLFGFMAWYSLTHTNGLAIGILFALGALAFLAMLIGGAIFDKPR